MELPFLSALLASVPSRLLPKLPPPRSPLPPNA